MDWFLDTLPAAQRTLWPRLNETPSHFVLYGGTALALRLGHRVSEDFDFFSNEPFNPQQLRTGVPYLRGSRIEQNLANTLTCIVGEPDGVKVSFFGNLPLRSVQAPDQGPQNATRIASLLDLAGTKAAVVQQRAHRKDYVDMAALITAGVSLSSALSAGVGIFGQEFNPMLTLKALSYHGDPELRDASGGDLPRDVRDTLLRAVSEVDVSKIGPLETRPTILAGVRDDPPSANPR